MSNQVNPNELTKNDLVVLETLSNSTRAVSQRDLSRRTGLSLGLVNSVIRKLVHTGFVRTSQLNRRQIEYLLTSNGFSHAVRKSYHYIVDTVKRYHDMHERLKVVIEGLRAKGFTDFYLVGVGELAEFVRVFFAEDGMREIRLGVPQEVLPTSVVLNASPEPFAGHPHPYVNLVSELCSDGHFDFWPRGNMNGGTAAGAAEITEVDPNAKLVADLMDNQKGERAR